MEICIAGAGAGKTTTMASRIIDLREKIDEHKMIFCITFTNNATLCIENKLLEYYTVIPDNIKVSTIHSFLYREFIKPYYYLLYRKQYTQISVSDLPTVPQYKYKKISRLDERGILHQTTIPEKAKWIVYQKSKDTKVIKEKRKIVMDKFSEYCGAICVDETQDIDADMQIIIEQLDKIGIQILLMGDPKQDLKGHKCFRKLTEKYKKSVKYKNICYRCPQKHLLLSNKLVSDTEKQYSEKKNGTINIYFESDTMCADILSKNTYDLTYISKKQGDFNTHPINEKKSDVNALAEEIEIVMKINHPLASELTLKRGSYYYAEQLIDVYNNTGDKAKAMNNVLKIEKIDRKWYGVIINTIPNNALISAKNEIVVSSIDAIKGKEGMNCLFILTLDLAVYLFGDKSDETVTKNRLYVALTRSLDKLSFFVTKKVETQYGKNYILNFFSKIVDIN